MKYLLFDIGSSTIKPYLYTGKKLKPLKQTSVHFKKNFTKGNIDSKDKEVLIKFIESLTKKYPGSIVKTYATSVFRDIVTHEKAELVEELFSKTKVLLNTIDQTTESLYLQMALVDKYKTKTNIFLVNIGGGSTELIVLSNNQPIERKNIKLGVGTVIGNFPTINNEISGVALSDVTKFIKNKLPKLKNIVDVAFYTGGELNYMQLAKYALRTNNLFNDKEHPSIIKLKDFIDSNGRVFTEVKLKELERLMPENPKWMRGARACSALAQAIFQEYKIKTIVPSNSNLIDGVVRYEFGN